MDGVIKREGVMCKAKAGKEVRGGGDWVKEKKKPIQVSEEGG